MKNEVNAQKFYFEIKSDSTVFVLGEGVGTIIIRANPSQGKIHYSSPQVMTQWFEYQGQDWVNDKKDSIENVLSHDLHALVKEFPKSWSEALKFYQEKVAAEKKLQEEEDAISKHPKFSKMYAKRIVGQDEPEKFYDP